MAQRVAGGGFGDPGRVHCRSKGSLEDCFVEVMPASLAGGGVEVEACCREDPLPCPFSRGGRVLETECARELYVAGAGAEIGRVLTSNTFELSPKIGRDGFWQKRDAIFLTLALANDDVTRAEVQILDAQSSALGDPQTSAVEQPRHE